MDTKRSLSSLLHFRRCRGGDIVGDGHPPPPLVPLPVDGVAINKPLAYLPQKADLVAFTSTFLRINSQNGEFLPVILVKKGIIPDLGDKLFLDCLQSVYRDLVSGGPQLAAVIQPWLDKAAEHCEHQTPTPRLECSQRPAYHPAS